MSEQLFDWHSGNLSPAQPGEYPVVRFAIDPTYPSRTRLTWTGSDWEHTHESSLGKYVGTTAVMSPFDMWFGFAADPNAAITDEQTDDHTGICLEH